MEGGPISILSKAIKGVGKTVGKVAAKAGSVLGPIGAPIQFAGRVLEGQSAKDALQRTGVSVGKNLSRGSQLAQFVPGAGKIAAPLMNVAGEALQGHSVRQALPGAAMQAVAAKYGGPLLDRAASKLPGGAKVLSAARSFAGAPGTAPGGGDVPLLPPPQIRDILGGGAPQPRTVGAAALPSSASAGGGSLRDGIVGAVRGALGGRPITIGNVVSSISGGDGSLADVVKTLGTLGITAAGLKAGHDATANAHELQKRNMALGDELAGFGRRSLASADTFRDAAQGPLLLRLNAGAAPANDFSRFADTLNPYRKRFGGMPTLPPPGAAR